MDLARLPLALACLLAGAAAAQSPTVPRQARQIAPAAQPPSLRPASPAPPSPARPAPLPTHLGQRPQASPLPVHGPSTADRQTRQTGAPGLQPAPPKVYGRDGQPLYGMKEAGPNRVLDVRTGRYHDTVPSGDGVRIVH